MLKALQNRTGFTLIELMMVVTIIGILAAISIPQYTKYIKRSRTSNGIDHARMICISVKNWIASPSMSSGDLANFPPVPVTTAGRDGKTFPQHFPSEGGWLAANSVNDSGADPYYQYLVDFSGGALGGTQENPAVQGLPWSGQDGYNIYGGMVQAGGIGVKSSNDLSGCRSIIEYVSSAY